MFIAAVVQSALIRVNDWPRNQGGSYGIQFGWGKLGPFGDTRTQRDQQPLCAAFRFGAKSRHNSAP